MDNIVTKIHTFADRFEKLIKLIPKEKHNNPIREGGWSLKQLIHHLADAQSQAYFRTKWLLTEENPTLKPFDGNDWVDLTPDEKISGSVCLIRGAYKRWDHLLRVLKSEDWQRTGYHPEKGQVTVNDVVEYFGNHGEDHLSQIQAFVDNL